MVTVFHQKRGAKSMADGIYSALSGALMQVKALNVVSNNLANANTPGFKSQRISFDEALMRSDGVVNRTLAQVRVTEIQDDFSQGSDISTGNALDVALDGEGFFVVETPEGERYTRQGSFSLSSQGTLVGASGFAVQGEGGEIVAGPEGQLSIGDDGIVSQLGIRIGRLKTVKVSDPNALVRQGNSLWALPESDSGTATVEEAPVGMRAGFLEGSNVNMVHAMTEMIQVSRAYEMFNRTIEAYKTVDKRTTNDMGA